MYIKMLLYRNVICWIT